MRTHSEFQRVFKEGTRFFRDGLGFCVRKVSGIQFRYAIAVPKRYGKAVERNRLRRRLREIIRLASEPPESAEIIINVRRRCEDLPFDLLKNVCEWAFAKVRRLRFREVQNGKTESAS